MDDQTPRDQGNWAKPVDKLSLGDVPADAINLNVEGHRVAGIAGGFGKMWQKTYKVSLAGSGVKAVDVISAWKQRFPEFWPEGNRFFGPLTGISPGDVALLNVAMPGRVKLSTGILVIYADEESFSFMTPEGHMFNGMITFSATDEPDGPLAQVKLLIRAQDPVYELGLTFGGHRQEDKFWLATLSALARHFSVEATPEAERVLIDKRRQWSHARNFRKNAAMRSVAHMVAAPFRRKRGR